MTIIHGTYKSGHVELDSPVDWPEGYRVEIRLTPEDGSSHEEFRNSLGLREREWPTTTEGNESGSEGG